jgi:hypothetical protein
LMGRYLMPHKLNYLKEAFGEQEFTLLDVGASNHSASEIRRWIPNCRYYGIDRDRNYNNDEDDFIHMEKFWEKDLTSLAFDDIPDNFFDALMMSHVIEHLQNGEQVIEALLPKVKAGGVIYIEYPSFRSTRLPSKKGCLNFFDDLSHCRLYSLIDIYNILLRNDFKIAKGGVRRDIKRILLMPLIITYLKIRYGYVEGGTFWDLFGLAEFVFASKKNGKSQRQS